MVQVSFQDAGRIRDIRTENIAHLAMDVWMIGGKTGARRGINTKKIHGPDKSRSTVLSTKMPWLLHAQRQPQSHLEDN
jgi:hypothetical protein